jgi:hypothetical protein
MTISFNEAHGFPSFLPFGIKLGEFQLSGSTDAIPLDQGFAAVVTATGVDAMTLATPVSGGPFSTPGNVLSTPGQNQLQLLVLSTTAHAHTITVAANKFNGTTHVATFSGTLPNWLWLYAFAGVWYTLGSAGVTLS